LPRGYLSITTEGRILEGVDARETGAFGRVLPLRETGALRVGGGGGGDNLRPAPMGADCIGGGGPHAIRSGRAFSAEGPGWPAWLWRDPRNQDCGHKMVGPAMFWSGAQESALVSMGGRRGDTRRVYGRAPRLRTETIPTSGRVIRVFFERIPRAFEVLASPDGAQRKGVRVPCF